MPESGPTDVERSQLSVKASNSSEADLTQLEDYVVTPKDDWQTVGPSGEAKTMLATSSVAEEPEIVSRRESRFFTRRCSFFAVGCCRYGKDCTFQHDATLDAARRDAWQSKVSVGSSLHERWQQVPSRWRPKQPTRSPSGFSQGSGAEHSWL